MNNENTEGIKRSQRSAIRKILIAIGVGVMTIYLIMYLVKVI